MREPARGWLASALHRLGYRDLHALEVSSAMQAGAEKKRVYQSFLDQFLGPVVDLDSQSFDAILTVGTLTSGPIGPQVLPELARIARPGGWIILTLVPEFGETAGYFEVIRRLERLGTWRAVEKTEEFPAFANRPDESQYSLWVFQIQRLSGVPRFSATPGDR